MNARSGAVCAIIGAEEGLGASLAREFAADGCDIALVSRTSAGSANARDAGAAAQPIGVGLLSTG